MHRKARLLLTLMAIFVVVVTMSYSYASADTEVRIPSVIYPFTKRIENVEKQFGTTISDPYRWLENDSRTNEDVLRWVIAERQTSSAYLNTLPGRAGLKRSLTALLNYEYVTAPEKRGNRYFYTRKSGQQNQAVLFVRESVDGPDRTLIDPNRWSTDGADAFAEWEASYDGSRLAYATQRSGSDWRTIRVVDVNTGTTLDDEIRWVHSTSIAWIKDGSGFFYSRYPKPNRGNEAQSTLTNHAVYFHVLGTPQTRDRVIYARPDQPLLLNAARVTDDGRYAVIYSSANLSTNAVTLIDLSSADWKPRKLMDNLDNRWMVRANIGTKLFLVTDKNARHSKLVSIDVADANPTFKDILPEQDAVLTHARLIGRRLIASYLIDAKTELRRYTLDGMPDGKITLPGIGSVQDIHGDLNDTESFFVFTSFNTPGTVYRYDVVTGSMTVWIEPNMQADLTQVVVDQVFYASKDGTRVPMFLIRQRNVTTPAATLLYGHGDHSISFTPTYSASLMAWVDQGGILAIPGIRGSGRYGTAWHQAGTLAHTQNRFDDVIAAAQYLHAQGIAPPDGIAIQGESSGGLLVGAVINQRPDLFSAALPSVGVMDLLRLNQHTGGQLWVGEYGDPARDADFRRILAYSPHHNIQSGKTYPAILATTADAHDRVIPGHTFKYIAALQAADIGRKPHLVRIETRAGDGASKPTDKLIDEVTDMWAFAAYWTGLDVRSD